MSDEIDYEYKTVRTVRGTSSLIISKMEKDGWEVVEEVPGTLRSTLEFRRPKKPLPWLLIGSAAAGIVVLAIVIGVAAALSGEDARKADSDKALGGTSKKPSVTAASSASESAGAAVITPQGNADFAALLKADSCDDANREFAARHKGDTVAFDGSIVNMAHHGDYDTRYDFLLGPGDRGPVTAGGPAFKYENVNISDLNLTGEKTPTTVGVGDKFRFVAEVGEFNAGQCLFFLAPVSTEARH
ncbi:DUF4839 domain-containing protein [Streptomyces sp. NPDC090080]|uniref:DUF4839 domain-containing protein n=1 Tax=Streptomyces sp. NPDC090080 TaxID=3365939 RepID=UPI00382C79DC